MKIETTTIIQRINQDFAPTYRNAAPFVNSGPLWDFCISILSDPVLANCIVFSNDLEIPPVKSLLHLYNLKFSPTKDFKFSHQESQWLGALMGFVFKFILGYDSQKDRVRVQMLGVGGAARFLNGPSNIRVI